MGRDEWKAGDLVRVESTQKTGWGDECHSNLVLVLGRYKQKYSRAAPSRDYPLSAYLHETSRKEDVVYEVLRDDGQYVCLALKDYAWPGARLTNRLVQRSCPEEET